MQIKIHSAYRNITALADTNLINKTFIEGRKRIDITSKFFKDKEVSKQEAIKILKNMEKEDSTFFIVGKESIETAIEAKIINKNSTMTIDNIPIALGLF